MLVVEHINIDKITEEFHVGCVECSNVPSGVYGWQ
jgi:hypothetical protein